MLLSPRSCALLWEAWKRSAGERAFGLRSNLISALKFVLAMMLLPVVVTATAGFYKELMNLQDLRGVFLTGILSYVVMHLFLFIPKEFYQSGRKTLSWLFRFSPPVASAVSFIFPFFAMFLLLVFYIIRFFLKLEWMEPYVIFLSGGTLAMHVVLTAQDLYHKDRNVIKPQYLLSMSLVYVPTLIIMAFLMDLNFEGFSFASFYKVFVTNAKGIYLLLYYHLFAG